MEKNYKPFIIAVASSIATCFVILTSLYFISPGISGGLLQSGKMYDVRKLIQKNYFGKAEEKKMDEGAIAGVVESLKDPYSIYFTKDEMSSFLERSEGSYVGIGIRVNTDEKGYLNILEVIADSPALAAGLKKNDKILEVDNKDVTMMKDEEYVVNQIKGKENTMVKLKILRPSQKKNMDFEIKRNRVRITNVTSEVLDGNIGFIRLAMFDSECAKDFNNHLNALLEKGIKGLVIDVRDNPGGNYDQVVSIADRILPKGKMIVYTKEKSGKKKEEISDEQELNMPISVLTNGYSASASEILAAALRDNKKAVLIGTKTYGKGLVQSVYTFADGSGVKLTVAKYFTPSNICIDKIGITPDINIEESDEFRDHAVSEIPKNEDLQLVAAKELIKTRIK